MRSLRSSSGQRNTSQLLNALQQKKSSRLHQRRISWLAQSFSRQPITKFPSTITINGGATLKARTGVTRSVRKAILKARRTIPWWRLRTLMRRLTQNGRVNVCRPKRSLNLLHAAVCQEKHTCGATNFASTENGWPTRGRENFQCKTQAKTVTRA